MSEANRLEESIRSNSLREIDLVPLVREVFDAYRGVYTQHKLALDLQPVRAMISGVPELVVQALDKLMDNAASFCPADGTITLALVPAAGNWDLSVANEGPTLPATLQDHLFDPMVSLRDNSSSGVHLGLGLHVVRLIVEFHRGNVRAANLTGDQGVCLTMQLPASQAQPTEAGTSGRATA
jgi:K+-sensing histidine kinase KdpD